MAPRPTVSKADKLQTRETSLNPARDGVMGQPRSQKTKEVQGPSRREGQGHLVSKRRACHHMGRLKGNELLEAE